MAIPVYLTRAAQIAIGKTRDITSNAVKLIAMRELVDAASDLSVPDAIMFHLFDLGELCFICLPDGASIRVDLVDEWVNGSPLPASRDEFETDMEEDA